MDSKSIEEFLAFLRNADERYRMAVENEKDANDATQDILHAVELNTYNSRRTGHLVKTLKTVRKNRRIAKETKETLLAVVEWAENHKDAVKSLERLLGEVRKTERHIQNRIYSPRTDIMEEEIR